MARVLPFDRQVEVVGDVLDYLVSSAVRVDVPLVTPDGEGEAE